jgi:hypothetical protein
MGPRLQVRGDPKKCSCHCSWLEGLPCWHLLAVYIQVTPKELLNADHFLQTFALVIPTCCRTEYYVKCYAMQVNKAILTYMEMDDDVLPPCDPKDTKRGPTKLKRFLGRTERGFASVVSVGGKPYKKTKQNIEEKRLDTALQALAEEPERSLRSAVGEEAVDLEEQVVGVVDERSWGEAIDCVLGFFN